MGPKNLAGSPSLVTRVEHALRLRRWAIGVLGRPDAPGSKELEGLPLESWREFLRLERCAAPLVAALRRRGLVRSLGEPAEHLLRDAARHDAERSLRAERDGRQLGALAASAGMRVVVLKGGAATLSGRFPALALEDLDLLVEPEHREALLALLRDDGYVEARRTRAGAECYHPSDRLPLDVHWGPDLDGCATAPGLGRAVPLPAVPGLFELAPRDQLEHLVLHAVVHHAERLPQLRDLLLIGAAAARCDETELRVVRKALSGHGHGEAAGTWFDFARGLWSGSAPSAEPYESSAVGYRLADALSAALGRGRPRPPAALWRFAAVESRRLSALEMVRAGLNGPPTNVRAFARIHRSSWIGGRAVGAVRAAFYLAATASGAPLTIWLRRRLRVSAAAPPHRARSASARPGRPQAEGPDTARSRSRRAPLPR